MNGRRPYSRVVGDREGLRNNAAVSSETNCFSALSCIHSVRNIPAVTNAAALRYANSRYGYQRWRGQQWWCCRREGNTHLHLMNPCAAPPSAFTSRLVLARLRGAGLGMQIAA